MSELELSDWDLKDKCRQIRSDIIDIFAYGNRGHLASAFSVVEILAALYYKTLKQDSKNPNKISRDRFILSKGHGCLAQYSILADLNYFSKEHFKTFCTSEGILGGHPTMHKVAGIEASTGSLGHGPSIGIGMALSLKKQNLDNQVYVLVGDGECNEGSIWEAALSASKNKLNNFTLLVDYNKFQSYGTTKDVCDLEPFADKWQAFGFETFEVDVKNDPNSLVKILKTKRNDQPRAIICHTIKGMGNSLTESDLSWHHKNRTTEDEIKQLKEAII